MDIKTDEKVDTFIIDAKDTLNNQTFNKFLPRSSGGFFKLEATPQYGNLYFKSTYYKENGDMEYIRLFDSGKYTLGTFVMLPDDVLQRELVCTVKDNEIRIQAFTDVSKKEFKYVIYCDDKLVFYGERSLVSLETRITYVCRDRKNRDCLIKNGEIDVWTVSELPNKIVYVKLQVPEISKRKNVSIDGMYIIEYAEVLEIVDKDGKKYDTAKDCMYDKHILEYHVGKTIKSCNYDTEKGCIHVYLHKDLWNEYVNSFIF